MNINLNELMQTQPDKLIFWKDDEGKIQGCTDLMAEVLQAQTPNSLIGKNDFDLFLPEEARFFINCDQQVMSENITRQFYDHLTFPNKKLHLLTIKAPLINAENKTIGVFGTAYFIKTVHQFQTLIKSTSKRFLNSLITGVRLTDRQSDILMLLAKGKTAKEIAEKLSLSSRTVEAHLAIIKEKLNVRTKSQLLDLVYQDLQ